MPEYAKINIREELIKEYNLLELATPDGWVYIKCIHGMYSLPQLGSLGHDLLEEYLNKEECCGSISIGTYNLC